MNLYSLICACGCGTVLGSIEVDDPSSFRGPAGYNSYVAGHPIPGLSYMPDGSYVQAGAQ